MSTKGTKIRACLMCVHVCKKTTHLPGSEYDASPLFLIQWQLSFLPVSPCLSSIPLTVSPKKSTLLPWPPSSHFPHLHSPLSFPPLPSVCQEHKFPLTPLPPIAFLALTVRWPFPLSISGKGGGRGLALCLTRHWRHLRQVMLQQGRMEGHGGHRDRTTAAATCILAITVGVVELLCFRWTEKTGSGHTLFY